MLSFPFCIVLCVCRGYFIVCCHRNKTTLLQFAFSFQSSIKSFIIKWVNEPPKYLYIFFVFFIKKPTHNSQKNKIIFYYRDENPSENLFSTFFCCCSDMRVHSMEFNLCRWFSIFDKKEIKFIFYLCICLKYQTIRWTSNPWEI